MKRLLSSILVLATCLSSTGPVYAADPRKLLRAQKSFFDSIEEEEQGRRRTRDLQHLEGSKLALLEQKSALSGLIARNGSTKPPTLAVKPPDPARTESGPDIPYADYDDVRDLPPVEVPEPDEISGSYGQGILKSPFTILDPAHPVSKMVHTVAGSIFYSAAMQAIQKVRNEAELGPDPSRALASARNLIKEAPLSASMIRAVADAAIAGGLQPTSFFDPLLREVAILAAYTYVANAPKTLADYDKEKTLYGYGGSMTYSAYVGWKAAQMLNNDDRISSAVSAAVQELNFTPLLDLYSSYTNLSGSDPGVSALVLMGREALSVYADARKRYDIDRNSYEYQQEMSRYGSMLSALADRIAAMPGKIKAEGVHYESSRGGGTARVDVLGGSADYRDRQGNSVTVSPAAGPKLDFSLGRALSDVVKGALKHIRPWTKKIKNADGSSAYRQTDDNQAHYAGLSKSYPDLTVRKVVERGADTVWQFVNKNTGELVMEVTTPDSQTLEVNQAPLGLQGRIRLTEYYDNSKLAWVKIEDLDRLQVAYILKSQFMDAVRYDPKTGVVAEGIITNNLTDDPDKGFVITMRGGLTEEVYLGDASLYGAPTSISGASETADVEAKRTIERLAKDSEKQSSAYIDDDFQALKDFIQRQLTGTGLRGQLSLIDVSMNILDPRGGVIGKTRSQAGDYYSEPDLAGAGKYNRGVINFSPRASTEDNKIVTRLEGSYGRDIKLLQSTHFNIPELGVFGSLAGTLQDLAAKASAKAGAYMRSIQADIDFKTQVSIDTDSDGKRWVAMRFATVGKEGGFTVNELKMLLPKNEKEAERSKDGNATYLLGKLISGLYAGQGATALPIGQMKMIQDFLVSKVQEMNTQLLMIADQAARKTVESFNKVFTPSVLDEVFHVFLRSIPAMARKITVSGAHTAALQALPADYGHTALPIHFGLQAFDAIYQPYMS
ncbi:MAG: hypothetical protein MOGMAGMI_02196 [Candidatus Omnitrophica bacterium]|nr:hypothetical protein [Candidatus Omnitrophota bacterium]